MHELVAPLFYVIQSDCDSYQSLRSLALQSSDPATAATLKDLENSTGELFDRESVEADVYTLFQSLMDVMGGEITRSESIKRRKRMTFTCLSRLVHLWKDSSLFLVRVGRWQALEQTSGQQLRQQAGLQSQLHSRRSSEETRSCTLHQAGETGDIPPAVWHPLAAAVVRTRVQFPLYSPAVGHNLC